MLEATIACPKDPENHYFVRTCEEIFRKQDLRHWCRNCEAFEKATERAADSN